MAHDGMMRNYLRRVRGAWRATHPSSPSSLALALAMAALCAAIACTPSAPRNDIRQWTEDMMFRISPEPSPPRAREKVRYKVVVLDKESRQPIEHGEGRIFAMNADSARTWDGLAKGPEPGTYYANLNFVTAGQWAIALEFRRDSTRRLERMDWTQDVRAATSEF